MSASTVSITANTAFRRRPVVVGDKKSGIEIVGPDAVAAGTGAGGGDRFSDGKDLSQSFRGEAILERSRDVVQVKKALPSSAAALPARRTTRKGAAKTEKPRWQTVISVFTKNLVLLLVLLGFAQMVRRLMQYPGNTTSVGSSTELEDRIAELEGFLKSTTKMMQVQVEVVDQKIGHEIGGLRIDLNKKMEAIQMEFANDMQNLDGRTESLEKSLGELRATDWLKKEDFVKFLDEFKTAKGLDDGPIELNLDEVRAFAREIVEKEIEKHAADGLGKVDYALASGGAKVVKHSEPLTPVKTLNSWFYPRNLAGINYEAHKMLTPSFGEPGQCFPLKGGSGFVQIRLRTAIIPEAITLEHVAKSVAYDRSSAPKDCRVSGWLHGRDIDQVVDTEKMLLLTQFTYDLEKSNAQTFDVLDTVGTGVVDTIRLDITSNHGSPSHTCIYRLRVHGHEPTPLPVLATQS